jgi:hypothetical protein
MVCQNCGDSRHTLCLKDNDKPCTNCNNPKHSICNGTFKIYNETDQQIRDNKRLVDIARSFSRDERKAEQQARDYFNTKTELEIENILTNHTESMTSIIQNNRGMDMSFDLEDIFVTYVMGALRYVIYMEEKKDLNRSIVDKIKTLLFDYSDVCDNCGYETCKCDEIDTSDEEEEEN